MDFIVTDKKETQHLIFINKQVKMSKINIAGKEIPGAVIQVIDKNNNVVDEWTSTTEPHYISNLVEGE